MVYRVAQPGIGDMLARVAAAVITRLGRDREVGLQGMLQDAFFAITLVAGVAGAAAGLRGKIGAAAAIGVAWLFTTGLTYMPPTTVPTIGARVAGWIDTLTAGTLF